MPSSERITPKRFWIESNGVAATPGLNRVVEPRTMEVLYFPTRAAAMAHKAEILPAQPSKYLPLVVKSEAT